MAREARDLPRLDLHVGADFELRTDRIDCMQGAALMRDLDEFRRAIARAEMAGEFFEVILGQHASGTPNGAPSAHQVTAAMRCGTACDPGAPCMCKK